MPRLLCFALLLTLPLTAAAQEPRRVGLAEVDLMVRAGALGLAQGLVVARGMPVGDLAWIQWERKWWDIARLRGAWGEARARWRELPSGLTPAEAMTVRAWRAEAALHSGDAAVARRELRALVWGGGGDAVQVAEWRRAMIRTYLSENKIADAQTAVRRFHLEYRPDDAAWSLLSARALLLADDAESAAAHLAALQSAAARTLLLVARLRSGAYAPAEVMTQAAALREGAGAALRRALWLVTAEAAAMAGDAAARVAALERAMVTAAAVPMAVQGVVTAATADLLAAYAALAMATAAELGLGAEDDAAWLAAVAEEEEEDKPAAAVARALAVQVIRRTADEELRGLAHGHFVSALLADGLFDLVFDFYGDGDGEYLAALTDLAPGIRYQLAEQSIAAGDAQRAAQLLHGLATPPADKPALDWHLRRAQIAIYAGDFNNAAQIIAQLIDGDEEEWTEKQIDRVLKVIFDFQKVEAHTLALGLMKQIAPRITIVQQKRELLYWTAQSESASGRHARAAELYLRSAMLKDDGLDRWGQSARFRAAEALTEAQLVDDARGMYALLLRGVKEPVVRANLQQRMEKLQLSKP